MVTWQYLVPATSTRSTKHAYSMLEPSVYDKLTFVRTDYWYLVRYLANQAISFVVYHTFPYTMTARNISTMLHKLATV